MSPICFHAISQQKLDKNGSYNSEINHSGWIQPIHHRVADDVGQAVEILGATFPSCDQNGTKNTESNSRVTLISANLEEMQTQTAPKDQPLTKPTFTPGCLPKHHLSKPRPCARYIAIRNSCCSMCCYDDDRR
ncbi:unnamed protein product [Arctia plantaginis]|uniref:Uncharacterized protein n=1 Tax=Arctia plantaginis TaxID=874455 RepID=A0A8S0ZFI3_ARCPL|nr:unnamed protein product [Arctia plantaginis]